MKPGGAEYIRVRYGVPAKRGGFLRFTGGDEPAYAKIVGFENGRLRVRFEGETLIKNLHPSWKVEYLPADPPMFGPWTANRLPPEVEKQMPRDNLFGGFVRQYTADALNAYDKYRERVIADWYDTHDSITGERLDRR